MEKRGWEVGDQGTYFLPLEVGVLDDAHDGGEAQGALVDGLQKVGCDHDGEHALVDQTAEARVFLGRDLDARVRHVRGELLVHLGVVLAALLELGRLRPLGLDDVLVGVSLVVARCRNIVCCTDRVAVAGTRSGHCGGIDSSK
jgi:hypothetical protein